MKKILLYGLLLETAFVLEGTVRHLPLAGIRVDLVWIFVIYLGFFLPVIPGGIVVFLIGLAQESAGVPLHGVLPVSYLAIFLFLRGTHKQLFFERGASQVIWVVLLTVAQKGI